MNSLSKIFTAIFCLAFFLLIPNTVKAQTENIEKVLNSDGTIKPGHNGSYNVKGYTLANGINGQPVLVKSDSLNKSGKATPKGHFSKGIDGALYSIDAIAVSGTDVYIGGSFTVIDDTFPVNNIVKWNGSKWSVLGYGTSNGVNGKVQVILVNGTDLYVGGTFSKAGVEISANHMAKYNTITQTWSNLPCGNSNGVAGRVYSLAFLGTELYVVGGFTQLGDGTSAKRIAKYNTITQTWSNLPCGVSNGVDAYVYSVAVLGTDLYVGGDFTQLGDGTSANRIAKWNTITNTWSNLPCGSSNGVKDNYVNSVAVLGTDLYVGGDFLQLGDGTWVNRIAKYNTITQIWSTLPCGNSSGVNGTVYSLAVLGTDLYVGGIFTGLGDGTSVRSIVKYNTITNTWVALGSQINSFSYWSNVRVLASAGTGVYVGLDFLTGCVSAKAVAKWSISDEKYYFLPVESFEGLCGTVTSFAVTGADIYMGGWFLNLCNGEPANNIAKYNTETRAWSVLPCGNSIGIGEDFVFSLAVVGKDLYVGGRFTQLGDSSSANYIVKYDTETKAWSTLPCGNSNGVNGEVRVLAVAGTDLYIGGFFTQLGDGTLANHIAKYNTTTKTWSTLPCGNSSGVNNYVQTLAVIGEDLYIGGGFTQLGDGTQANHIVKWNTETNTWSTLPCGNSNGVKNYSVESFGVLGTDLYVGGGFFQLSDDTWVNCIVKWNTATNAWSTLPSGVSRGVNGAVCSIVVVGEDIYIGGEFYQLGDGTSANRIAKWNTITTTWSTLPCGTFNGLNNRVNALAVQGTDLYIGGSFDQLGDETEAYGIVKYNTLDKTWSTLRDLTDVKDPSSHNSESPTTYALQQNYPNPFNPSTTISYDIASPAMVTMVLYDALGREVRTLVNEEKNAGKYTLNLNASTLASGVYFYQLRAGKFVQTKKLMLLK